MVYIFWCVCYARLLKLYRYCVWHANTAGKKICADKSDFNCPSIVPLPTTEFTVAEMLKEAGYRTAMFGKWHLGDLKPLPGGHPKWNVSHPGLHGFDVWKVTERSAPTANPNCMCFNPSQCVLGHYSETGFGTACTNYHSGNGIDPDLLVPHNETIIGDDSNFIAREFSTFLNDTVSTGQQPFFAYIAFHTVHAKYVAVPPYAQRYAARGYIPKEIDYYGSITAMDAAIGKIRDLLEHHRISDNTMIWFTSDNGPAKNSPGSTRNLRGSKSTLFEGGVRVPGIIEWPAVIQSNRISDFPVVTSDFFPTVSEILGRSDSLSHEIIDGESILPFIRGEQDARQQNIKWAFNIRGNPKKAYVAAILSGRQYKAYFRYRKGTANISASFLYDLLEDEAEETDISTTHQSTFAKLYQEVELWIQSILGEAKVCLE